MIIQCLEEGGHVLICCLVFYYLGLNMWGTWWHFGYVFHEGFNSRFFKVSGFFDGVFMHGSSHPNYDGDEGVYFQSVVLDGINRWIVFGVFKLGAWSWNLSRQYVDSMNWTVYMGVENIGVCLWFGALTMHRISCLGFSWHWHGWELKCIWVASRDCCVWWFAVDVPSIN